ncbi:MAG TPA: methyltransferase domain-containing protein [Methylovirgula sp.]|nr:methyltransferase domain-containing protein [Methylovirgula sp.]
MLSRLARLTGVDESTTHPVHDPQNCSKILAAEIPQHYWNQPVASPCEQSKSGGRAPTDTTKATVRGNVGALRAIRPKRQIMMTSESGLAALAGALIDGGQALTVAERKLICRTASPLQRIVTECRNRIRAGEDVLGEEFCNLRSPEKRRETGATYTPPTIIEAMMSWAASVDAAPERVIDPGVGSGRFLSAAAERFLDAKLVGIDIDPLALLMARANACVRGYDHRLQLELGDYRAMELASLIHDGVVIARAFGFVDFGRTPSFGFFTA